MISLTLTVLSLPNIVFLYGIESLESKLVYFVRISEFVQEVTFREQPNVWNKTRDEIQVHVHQDKCQVWREDAALPALMTSRTHSPNCHHFLLMILILNRNNPHCTARLCIWVVEKHISSEPTYKPLMIMKKRSRSYTNKKSYVVYSTYVNGEH